MWCIEVRVLTATKADGFEWRKMRPTNGQPYQFKTRAEAENTMEMCYPLSTSEEVRIVEIDK